MEQLFVPPSQFSGVYVFGDSLVDSGNDLKAAEVIDDFPFASMPEGAPTADKGYFEGRFTDGYNFADLISNKLLSTPTKATFPYGFEDPVFDLKVPFANRPEGQSLNFAYGGAQAVGGEEPIPDLDSQTDAYRDFPSANPTGLYIITIGANDVRALVPKSGAPTAAATVEARLQAAAAEIAQEVGQLFSFGARHVLVTGIPDVGLIPSFNDVTDAAMRRGLLTAYAEKLDGYVQAELAKLVLPAGAHLYGFDFEGWSDQVIANPAAFGFTNVTQSRTSQQQGALQPVGSGYLFFDQIHPSAQAHAQVAAAILAGGAIDTAVPLQPGPKLLGALTGVGQETAFTTALVAGQTYVFDLMGISSGSGSLPDPKLRLTGPGADAREDDGGLGLDAHLTFVAPATGTYTLTVSGVGVSKGSYVLQGPDLRGSDVVVAGGAGADTIGALGGANYLRGEGGDDSIAGGSGFDDINGNVGNDTAAGGLGDGWVVGGKDDDRLAGEDGRDIVYGNLGADTGDGGAGDDTLRGGQGDDVLTGGAGNDWLSGDRENDTLTGGAGADIFHSFGDAGIDRILDFSRAEGDRLLLDPGTTYAVAQSGADVVVAMNGGGQAILVGVSMAALTGDWIAVG
jgi:phospholipase/lecithinase/hemolysin